MIKCKKYHSERVQSLLYENEKDLSVGIIVPGEYKFGSIKKEITTITSGTLDVLIEGNKMWKTYLKDESFTIPEHKNFTFKTNEVCTYLCFYE
ncbi:MAG: pyrimidine/purine nucleoside phosphorylase [Bacteroidota bacterium]|nr:pyrimidine/purine nucleoside phosphorylase [Bacteroidota bacterium]